MSAIMLDLKHDHENVARLLHLLDTQLGAVHEAKHADFELMHDIMVYMTQYPDTTHHPKEDLVFEKVLARDQDAKPIVERLAREHAALAEKGRNFLDALRHVVDGSMVLRTELETQGKDYVEFLRTHMRIEDEYAFPIAERSLTDADWSDVESAIEARTDPVFGPVVSKEFESLFAYIEGQSEEPV